MKIGSLALLALAAACGSSIADPPPPGCDDRSKAFQACGGDIVGTWNPTVACGNPLPNQLAKQPACSTATWKATGIQPTGSVTFGTDGSEADAFNTLVSVSLAMPDACFAAVFTGQTPGPDACAGLQAQLGAAFNANGTCSYGAGACSCQVEVSNKATGTRHYVVSGSTLTYPDEHNTQPVPYCVSGSVLRARVEGDGGASTYYELTKR